MSVLLRSNCRTTLLVIQARDQGVLLIEKRGVVYESIVFGVSGLVAFAALVLFTVLQSIADSAHIKTNIEDAAGHDGEVFVGEGANVIEDQKRVVEVKGSV